MLCSPNQKAAQVILADGPDGVQIRRRAVIPANGDTTETLWFRAQCHLDVIACTILLPHV